MQNLRLQINLALGKQYRQTTGSASRRLLNGTAQLPKPSEAWHASRGSPVGTAGCPCSVIDQNFQLCYSSASHALLPRKQTPAQRQQGRSQGAYVQSRLSLYCVPVAKLLHLPRTSSPHLKSALIRPHLEALPVLISDLSQNFQSFDLMCIIPSTKVSHKCLQGDRKQNWLGEKKRAS